MIKISIPQPCHEDWNQMSLNEQGRHCNSCAKTVVDFTAMSDDEVKHFFLNKKEEHVCGRFKQKQLDQIVIDLPYNVFTIDMPLWKKFLAACLVVFSTSLFSCNTSIDGHLVQNGSAVEQVNGILKKISNIVKPDTSQPTAMVGQLLVMDTTKHPVQTCTGTTMGVTIPVPPTVHIPEVIRPVEEDVIQGGITMIADTVQPIKCEPVLMGKPALEPSANDPHKIKNPPTADAKDCDKKNYQ